MLGSLEPSGYLIYDEPSFPLSRFPLKKLFFIVSVEL